MMHFVRAPDALSIPIVGISEHLKPLMNKNIVDKEVRQSVAKDPQTNRQSCMEIVIAPSYKAPDTNGSVKKKEEIVTFPPAAMVLMVVILMQPP